MSKGSTFMMVFSTGSFSIGLVIAVAVGAVNAGSPSDNQVLTAMFNFLNKEVFQAHPGNVLHFRNSGDGNVFEEFTEVTTKDMSKRIRKMLVNDVVPKFEICKDSVEKCMKIVNKFFKDIYYDEWFRTCTALLDGLNIGENDGCALSFEDKVLRGMVLSLDKGWLHPTEKKVDAEITFQRAAQCFKITAKKRSPVAHSMDFVEREEAGTACISEIVNGIDTHCDAASAKQKCTDIVQKFVNARSGKSYKCDELAVQVNGPSERHCSTYTPPGSDRIGWQSSTKVSNTVGSSYSMW